MPKISELTSQASPTTAAVVPIVQAGTTQKATLGALPISTATQAALDLKTTNSAAAITGGTITGITDLAIADGGTGASTASAAFTALKQDATDAATGVVELATSAEYATGTDTTRALTPATARAQNLVAGTAVASTSGTSIDFTGIPSWVKRVTILLSSVSSSGTSAYILQLGDSGGVETSGYLGGVATTQDATATVAANFTTGIGLAPAVAATTVYHGVVTISLLNAATNSWIAGVDASVSNAAVAIHGSSSKSLSATLDRVRLTTVGGTDTFDAGTVNILYE